MPHLLVLAEGSLVSVNPGLAIWTLVTFLLVAVVLRWKVWGPLMHMIEAREKGWKIATLNLLPRDNVPVTFRQKPRLVSAR